MMDLTVAYFSGAVTAGYLVSALFFARFWRRTRDRLFLAFAIAFALLAFNQGLAAFLAAGDERALYGYALRVLGFILILAAIIDKNLKRQ